MEGNNREGKFGPVQVHLPLDLIMAERLYWHMGKWEKIYYNPSFDTILKLYR